MARNRTTLAQYGAEWAGVPFGRPGSAYWKLGAWRGSQLEPYAVRTVVRDLTTGAGRFFRASPGEWREVQPDSFDGRNLPARLRERCATGDARVLLRTEGHYGTYLIVMPGDRNGWPL